MKTVDQYNDVHLGFWADQVLEMCGGVEKMTEMPEIIGRDEDGLIVKWKYPGVVFTFAKATTKSMFGDITAYAVQKIEVDDDR